MLSFKTLFDVKDGSRGFSDFYIVINQFQRICAICITLLNVLNVNLFSIINHCCVVRRFIAGVICYDTFFL